jgi:hypothetical protein
MTIKRILICLVLLIVMSTFAVTAGCDVVTGSGKTSTFDMAFDDFYKIEAGYAFDVKITRADSYLIRITIDENLYEYLKINKSSNTLYIGLKSGYVYTNMTQQAVITMPDLYRLELSGASKAVVSGFSTTHDLDFELSGASKMDLENLEADDSDINLSGASEVTGSLKIADGKFDLSGASSLELEGSADDISVEASGASEVELSDFTAANVDVELSGASNAVINASSRLDVNLSGASDLKYIGSPKLGNINISGGSSIKQK